MLTNIRLRNFKSFKDTGDIPIAPLTVLTGPNSSGKSAIIRAMMALRQTVESRDQNTAFVPTGEYVDLGTFEDFAFKHDAKSKVGIDVVSKWTLAEDPLTEVIPSSGRDRGELLISLELAQLVSIDRVYLTQSVVELGRGDIQVYKRSMSGNKLGRSYRTSLKYAGNELVKSAPSSNARFHVMRPPFKLAGPFATVARKRRGEDPPDRTGELFAIYAATAIEESVSEELSRIHYIGPLRERPQRMYLSTGETPREVGVAGGLGPAVLWSASEAKQLDTKKLSEWCSRMGLALEIKLARVPGGYFRILIVDLHTGIAVNLPDVGVGTSQLLPILIQGLIAPARATLLLEQPEIHLHPKAQADLADFFIEVTKRDVGVIVETHSEHLINRLQRRIAEESLDPDSVALYYVTPSAEGSTLERVQINEYGQIPTAPDGFFEEGFEETFGLMSAVGKRRAREDRD